MRWTLGALVSWSRSWIALLALRAKDPWVTLRAGSHQVVMREVSSSKKSPWVNYLWLTGMLPSFGRGGISLWSLTCAKILAKDIFSRHQGIRQSPGIACKLWIDQRKQGNMFLLRILCTFHLRATLLQKRIPSTGCTNLRSCSEVSPILKEK